MTIADVTNCQTLRSPVVELTDAVQIAMSISDAPAAVGAEENVADGFDHAAAVKHEIDPVRTYQPSG